MKSKKYQLILIASLISIVIIYIYELVKVSLYLDTFQGANPGFTGIIAASYISMILVFNFFAVILFAIALVCAILGYRKNRKNYNIYPIILLFIQLILFLRNLNESFDFIAVLTVIICMVSLVVAILSYITFTQEPLSKEEQLK
ncbi:hypothetical protein LJB88_00405 [Erysipelotrichaceae bacterium OttesenSCG-928-M19]|nr:hypothetical protein [Erysipelotrichaceae bacterium OttesenSCG-928-M19]